MVTWKRCEYCNNFKVLYFDQSYIKICSNCIRIIDRLNKIKFLENNIERLEKKLANKIFVNEMKLMKCAATVKANTEIIRHRLKRYREHINLAATCTGMKMLSDP